MRFAFVFPGALRALRRTSAWLPGAAAALLLPGCGLLPFKDTALTDEAGATFAIEVRAPDDARELLERHLELQRFRKLPELQDSELQRLLGRTEGNARELLGTLGYFAPRITLELLEPPAEPAGPAASGATPQAPGQAAGPGANPGAAGKPALRTVVITVETGPQTHVGQADIAFSDAANADPDGRAQQLRVQRNWSLAPGQPFTQSAWDAAKNHGLRQLQSHRYPGARIAQSHADIDADRSQARLGVTYETGPAYRFGALRVEGSQRYDPDGARRLARLPVGAVYDEAEMLDAQLRLAGSGYYDSVFLMLDPQAPDPQAAAVIAQLREARLQKLVFGPGFSTDSGARLTLDHIHNQLPGLGWRAVSRLSLERKTQYASSEWTALPDERGWRWFTGGHLERENRDAYPLHSGRLRAGRSKASKHIDRNHFLQYDYSASQGPDAGPGASALSLNQGWTGRYFDSDTAPTRGYGLAAEFGLGSALRPTRDPFVRTLLRWQSFIPAGRVQDEQGRRREARIALRAEAGAVLAGAQAQIPATQLFMTGGDTSVRGYGYHGIGVRNASGRLVGGRYLTVGSVEWQRPIVYGGALTDWESTLFLDAGAVANHPGELRPRLGLGAGLRWRSPVGPLQADLAYGAHTRAVRLHLRLGFTF